MTLNRSLLALTFLALAGPAFGQDDERVKYKDRTEIDFEDVSVNGELQKPVGQLFTETKKLQFNPLIRLRDNFDVEMKQSVDEVK